MTSYSLDVELFISEVQKYPELWDISCEEYRLKNRKNKAWGEVAKIFIDDFEDLSVRKKDDVCKKLFNKWRNIRDSYVRHVKRKFGKKGYLYAKHLSFLSELYKPNLLGSDVEDNNDDTWPSDSEESKLKKMLFKSGCYQTKEEPIIWTTDEDSIDPKRKKRESNIEFVETNYTEASSSFAVLDEDKSFFDSLLPAVKDFTIDQKLEFRGDILKLIKLYRNKTPSPLQINQETD